MEVTVDLQSKLDAFLSNAKAGRSELSARRIDEFKNGSKKGLQKDKVELGTTAKRVYALELALPFDPRDVTNEEFNSDNKFIMEGSPTTAALLLKALAVSNEGLKARLASYIGKDADEWDVSDLTKLSDDDKAIFGKFRRYVHYALPVHMVRMSGVGEFGKKILSTAVRDSMGRVTKPDAAHNLYQLEQVIAQDALAELDKRFKNPADPLYNAPEKTQKEERKRVFDKMLVSNSYLLGTMRVLVLPLDEDGELKENVEDLIGNLGKYERYTSGNSKDLTRLETYIGSKHDTAFDYIDVEITYPHAEGDTDAIKKFNSYGARDVSNKPDVKLSTVPGFDEAYRKFRDNEKIFSEKYMVESVWDYQAMDADTLFEHYRAHLSDRLGLLSADAKKKHAALIGQLNSGASISDVQSLMEGIDIGEVTEVMEVTETSRGAGVNTEVDKGAIDLGLEDEE